MASRHHLAAHDEALAARATRLWSTRSPGASRTLPTSRRAPRTCRSAGPTRASSSQPRWAQWPNATWIGAGFPDYPWLFGTDAEYTAFAAVAVGQFTAIEDHLRALREISDILNNGSGVVTHEAVADGSIWFGHDSRQTNPDGSTSYDFNTDETVKFPSAVALLWRWTGDNAFRDEMYDFAVRNLRYVTRTLDADHDGWPEGLGNVERSGMGPEKLDNTVYFIRGLYDLADMAKSKHDGDTYAWATNLARKAQERFDATWWFEPEDQYADSLNDPGDVQSFQKHWIGQTPMEAELREQARHGSWTCSVRSREHCSRRA